MNINLNNQIMTIPNTIYKTSFNGLYEPQIIKPEYYDNNIIADFSKTKFLSEIEGFEQGLVKNCIFDKGHTGVGGTTLALESPENYCILMPFYKLVQEKGDKFKDNVLTVYSKTDKQQIRDYFKKQKKLNEPIKLVGTFNALPKILRAIPGQLKDIHLLVDEFQILRDAYSYRDFCIDYIMRNYDKFASYCFMSATPIIRRYMFDRMFKMKHKKVIFENLPKPTVRLKVSTEKTLEKVSEFIDKQVSKGKNVYCFLNHIGSIQQLINNNPNITVENCNVIYSEYNSKEVLDSNGNVFNRKPDMSVLKPYNFLTETAFSGIDIKDPQGVNIIVSLNACQDYTYHHPELVKQVVGRNRKIDIKEIYHFVEFRKPKNLSSEDFDKEMFKQHDNIKDFVTEMNLLNSIEERKEYYEKNSHSEKYIHVNDETDYNATYSNLEHLIFEAYNYYVNSLYWSLEALQEAYQDSGWIVEIVEDDLKDIEEFKNKKRGRRVNKNRLLQAIYQVHGDNFEALEWKDFLDKNELYKNIIEKGIKTPEQIINGDLSKKKLEQLWNDFQVKDSYFDLILNRIKQEKAFQIGSKFTSKQAIYLLAKIREDVLYKSKYKTLSPDGTVSTTLEKLDFSTDIEMVNNEPVKKLLDVKNVETPVKPSILLKEPYNLKKDLKYWNYINTKPTTFRGDDGKHIKGYIVLSYKII